MSLYEPQVEAHRQELRDRFVGKTINEIPTPSFVIDWHVVKLNSKRMLDGLTVYDSVKFRSHVKTHKTSEIVRLQLENGARHNAVVASTLSEIKGLLKLVEQGVVKDILYGIPPTKSKIDVLAKISNDLSKHDAQLRLMIDTLDQLKFLKEYAEQKNDDIKWSVYVKINVGDNRAGQKIDSNVFWQILEEWINSYSNQYFTIYGFYAHAGNSYGADGPDAAKKFLQTELDGVAKGAALARELYHKHGRSELLRFTLSVGATPTALTSSVYVTEDLKKTISQLSELDAIEVHAGNYAMLDLQQVATGLVKHENIAGTVVAEIIAYYPERDEYLIDAGVLALAREPGRLPGIAAIHGQPVQGERWIVSRVSQEHGIISRFQAKQDGGSDKPWKVGDRVVLYPQHACITSAMYQKYFVIEQDVVTDVVIPWRGWEYI
ncbi:putative serine dehydratase domain-containing protein [Lipomyces japonicus]|uniref:putative serine dehydratase domain-containing protein n=1 Tax=Lipomyces japonicus TaxID=56871 RepID=UPI0034CEE387